MRMWLITVTAVLVAFIQQAAPAAEITWQRDLKQAGLEAQKTGKPILMQVTADWCGFCHRMLDEVFTQDAVIRNVNQYFVPLLLDADANPRAIELIGVESYPSTIIISSDFLVVGRIEGYQTKDAFLRHLQPYCHAATKPSVEKSSPGVSVTSQKPGAVSSNTLVPVAKVESKENVAAGEMKPSVLPTSGLAGLEQSPSKAPALLPDDVETAPARTEKAPTELKSSLAESTSASKLPLIVSASAKSDESAESHDADEADAGPAFRGLCLVSMVIDRKVMKGQAEFTTTYRGRTISFSSAKYREEFLADPERFWPMLDGHCPVATFRGEADTTVDPQTVAVYRGHLVMFRDADHRKAFSQNPRSFLPAITASSQNEPAVK